MSAARSAAFVLLFVAVLRDRDVDRGGAVDGDGELGVAGQLAEHGPDVGHPGDPLVGRDVDPAVDGRQVLGAVNWVDPRRPPRGTRPASGSGRRSPRPGRSRFVCRFRNSGSRSSEKSSGRLTSPNVSDKSSDQVRVWASLMVGVSRIVDRVVFQVVDAEDLGQLEGQLVDGLERRGVVPVHQLPDVVADPVLDCVRPPRPRRRC